MDLHIHLNDLVPQKFGVFFNNDFIFSYNLFNYSYLKKLIHTYQEQLKEDYISYLHTEKNVYGFIKRIYNNQPIIFIYCLQQDVVKNWSDENWEHQSEFISIIVKTSPFFNSMPFQIVNLEQNNELFTEIPHSNYISHSINQIADLEAALFSQMSEKDMEAALHSFDVIYKFWISRVVDTADLSIQSFKIYLTGLIQALARQGIQQGGNPHSLWELAFILIEEIDDVPKDKFYLFFSTIVSSFNNLRSQDLPSYHSDIVNKAVRYIKEKLYEPLSNSDIAKHTSTNISYLSSHFSQVTGTTLKKFILGLRIEESKILLASTNLSIKEIAYLLHFSNQSHFTKTFKLFTGLTPNIYRKQTSK